MNIALAYGQMSGKTELFNARNPDVGKEALSKLKEEELSIQQKFDWLQHPNTREMFEALGKEEAELITQAVDLAASYPTSCDHNKIINLLVQVSTLRKVTKQYATHK